MRLTATEASGLSGIQVLQLVDETVAQEREAAAKIADAEAEHLRKHGAHSAEIAERIAAKIRARGIR